MDILLKEFKESGFLFKQLERDGNLAIYQRCPVYDEELVHFEVVVIQSHNGRTFPDGKSIGPAEFYPSASQWGIYGWTVTDKEKAFVLIKKLKEQGGSMISAVPSDGVKIAGKRGRRSLNIVLKLPDKNFTVKQLAHSHGVSTAYIYNHLVNLIKDGKAKFAGAKKITKGRGKSTNFYCKV